MSKLATCTLIAAVAVPTATVVALRMRHRARLPPALAEAADEDSSIAAREVRYSGWSKNVLAYASPSLRQEILYGKDYDSDDPTQLVVMHYSPWYAFDALREPNEVLEFSASFEITCARALTKDHFYLSGRAQNSDDVVERWKGAIVNTIGGGSGYVMRRKELYRGTGLGGVKSLGVDHGARYLLFIHGANPTKLSRMPIQVGPTLTTLYDSTTLPALNMHSISVFQRRHVTLGIVWTIEGAYGDGSRDYVLLVDSNDDGTIDSSSTLPESSYFAQYSISDGAWQDSFSSD